MRPIVSLALSALLFPAVVSAQTPLPVDPVTRSATKARDVNGVELGMMVADATRQMTVNYVQGELVQAVRDGIAYDFGVCPSGKIYRIQSSQELGNFVADEVFMDRLESQLVTKFGPATYGRSGNWSWELVEPVKHADGFMQNFKTNWVSVLVSESSTSPVVLDITMIDFRICWADNIIANQGPRDRASDAVSF